MLGTVKRMKDMKALHLMTVHDVMALGVQVAGSMFRVSGFGFRVPGFRFRVPGFGFRVSHRQADEGHEGLAPDDRPRSDERAEERAHHHMLSFGWNMLSQPRHNFTIGRNPTRS